MTDDELKAIEERAKAATPGPWDCTYGGSSAWSVGPESDPQLNPVAHVRSRNEGPEGADATFIAHARQDIPALSAEVRRLRGLLELKTYASTTYLAHGDEK